MASAPPVPDTVQQTAPLPSRRRSLPRVRIATNELVSTLAATLSSSGSFAEAPPSKQTRWRRQVVEDKFAQRYNDTQKLTHMCRLLRCILFGVPEEEQRRRNEITNEEEKRFAAAVCRSLAALASLAERERKREVQERHHIDNVRRRSERTPLRSHSMTVSPRPPRASPPSALRRLLGTPESSPVRGHDVTVATPSLRYTPPISTPDGWMPSPGGSIGRSPRMGGMFSSP